MKKNFLIIVLLVSTINCYSQSKGIIGSWLSLDSINKVQFFINSNGTIKKRTAFESEDVWSKTPLAGTYTFKKGHDLFIKWEDKSFENIEVKFIDNNAEFRFTNKNGKANKPYVFLRIVDEEIILDN